MPTLTCTDVWLRYGRPRDAKTADGDDACAVREASLTLADGQLAFCIGPNGAGKSTLLRAMAGLQRPTRGTVELDGKALNGIARIDIARQIAYLPQAVVASQTFTAREVVMLGRHPHQGALGFPSQADQHAVDTAMARTGTTAFAGRRFDRISGGERQRVLLASVLAQQAPLVLLDEPTTSLDLPHAVEFMQLLRNAVHDAKDAPTSALVVTHDLTLAGQFADRIVLMHNGRILADDLPDVVLSTKALTPAYGDGLMIIAHPDGGRPVVLPAATAPVATTPAS